MRLRAFRDRRGGKPRNWEDPLELRAALLDFIAEFANWDNSTDPDYLETSRALVQVAHESLGGAPSTRPLVVDPFAGGGSIPLALRVGADAFASDLNPVAVLLNKVVLEYIPKGGKPLAEAFRECAARVAGTAEKELARFFPNETGGARPFAYLWARSVLSEAPGGEDPVEIPLLRSMWLSSKKNRRVAFRWLRDSRGRVKTETVVANYADGTSVRVRRPLVEIFKPVSSSDVEEGTSRGGAAVCPVTEHTTPVEAIRTQLARRRGGSADARLLCVISADREGRSYRTPEQADLDAAARAAQELDRRKAEHRGSESLLPDGKLNHLRGFFNVVLYGMTTWADLFAPRQALALVVLCEALRAAAETEQDTGLRVALQTCLAMALDRCADKCASLVIWNIPAEKVEHVFGRQALPMVWDFAEANPLSGIGWEGACEWVAKVLVTTTAGVSGPGTAVAASATEHPLPDDSAEAVITDPPYYAAIPYADLSDFFYSWLKRSVGDLHPGLLSAPLTPKGEECVSLAHRAAMYREKDSAWFEATMTRALREARRIAKPSGAGLFVFANKETQAWEAMLAALIEAGWCVTASWPIDTERPGRLRAHNSAALASSVHLFCRPRERPDGVLRVDAIGDWRDILVELPKRIKDWMPRLADEGVVGADAIFACLGPALEIFSQYSRVEKASGDEVKLQEYLEHVWAAVAKEALGMIFAGAETSEFEEDARLTAMWLWTLSTGDGTAATEEADESDSDDAENEGSAAKTKVKGFVLEYDAARKIAQGLGAHLEDLASLVEVKGETARLLPVAERTRALFGKAEEQAPTARRKKRDKQLRLGFAAELEEAEETGGWGEKGAPERGRTVLDRVHQSMILFAASRGEALRRFLVDDGVGSDQRFWRLAQAFAALYPAGTDERRWVEGVLARKKGLGL